jgi:hypothetical protein
MEKNLKPVNEMTDHELLQETYKLNVEQVKQQKGISLILVVFLVLCIIEFFGLLFFLNHSA